MVYVIPDKVPDGVHPDLLALCWMIGRWEGSGHGEDDVGKFRFGQTLELSSNGKPYLHVMSQIYSLDQKGNPAEPLVVESGFWFPHSDASVDLTLAASAGWSELWMGKITGPKIELRTDAVVRMPDADVAYTAGHRLYGFVDGQLMWAYDRAVEGGELKPYMWAQLVKVAE